MSHSLAKIDWSRYTPFQKKVWEVVRNIPCGETQSYKWVAEKAGYPQAARAVGQALKKNPLPGIIPCHRVICSDGSLGGFSRGLKKKRELLRAEGITGARSQKSEVRSQESEVRSQNERRKPRDPLPMHCT